MKSDLFWLNGELSVEAPKVSSLSRSFRYGDGLFETVLVYNGKPLWLDRHLNRLTGSASASRLHVDPALVTAGIREIISMCTSVSARLRVDLSRNGSGYYLPEETATSLFIHLHPLASTELFPVRSIKAGFCETYISSAGTRYHKSTSCFGQVQASIEAQAKQWNEGIIMNHQGRVAEGISSNVFALLGDSWITPGLGEGILEGTTRGIILELMKSNGIRVKEGQLQPEDLLYNAREIFLTNSVHGISPVHVFNGRPLNQTQSVDLLGELRKVALNAP